MGLLKGSLTRGYANSDAAASTFLGANKTTKKYAHQRLRYANAIIPIHAYQSGYRLGYQPGYGRLEFPCNGSRVLRCIGVCRDSGVP